MEKLVNYFEEEFDLAAIDKSKLKYSLEVISNDISKLLILLVLFFMIGKTKDFLYSALALMTIRPFTGGLHFKTYFTCLVFSGMFFTTSIFLQSNISLNSNILLILLIFIFSFSTIFFVAPITSKNRPLYSKEKLLQFKIISLSVVMIHFMAYIILNKNPYLNNAIWVFVLQSIQLIIRKGVDFYEKKRSSYQKIT